MNRRTPRALSLDFLRSFEAVGRRLSFSAAADEIHLSQSAVSRQIKSLEDELGTSLFSRGTRRVELTAAGQTLLRAVAPLLDRLDASVRQIRISAGRAQISLSTFPSFASLWLMPRLAGYQQTHPDVDIRISASDRLMELDDPELDLLLRHCLPERAPEGSERMFGEVLTPVIGARLADDIAAGRAAPLAHRADLAGHTLVEMDDGNASAQVLGWRAWLAQQGLANLEPRRWLSVNFTHQQIQGALAGQGLALARLALVHDSLERGELVEPFGLAGRTASPYAYWMVLLPGARLRAELREFGAWVRLQAAQTRAAIGEG
jgi:LysR family glycine cleavage system transcriptional activator